MATAATVVGDVDSVVVDEGTAGVGVATPTGKTNAKVGALTEAVDVATSGAGCAASVTAGARVAAVAAATPATGAHARLDVGDDAETPAFAEPAGTPTPTSGVDPDADTAALPAAGEAVRARLGP